MNLRESRGEIASVAVIAGGSPFRGNLIAAIVMTAIAAQLARPSNLSSPPTLSPPRRHQVHRRPRDALKQAVQSEVFNAMLDRSPSAWFSM